ncbi:hypothetical protein [Arthrobacter sp. R1-13]
MDSPINSRITGKWVMLLAPLQLRVKWSPALLAGDHFVSVPVY